MKQILPECWECEIPLSEIGARGVPWTGGWELPLEEDIQYWGQSFSIPGEINVGATVVREEKGFLVTLSLVLEIQALCSRCLVPTSLAISEVFRYFYTSWQGDNEEEDNTDDAQIVLMKHFGTVLDVTQQVWESLILSLPSVVLCKDNCKGLCPLCGKNLNEGPCSCSQNVEDPRLEKLREFRLEEGLEGDSGEGGN